jgi:N-methylhydantoinase B/oxoprolinase/acetone carboxylase alpha subunit
VQDLPGHRRGCGDVLERDPEAVVADVETGYLSSEAAREIYFVVHDPATPSSG